MHPKNEKSPGKIKRFDIFFFENFTNVFKTKTKAKKNLHIHHEFQRSETEQANLEEVLVRLVGKQLDHEDLVFVVYLVKDLVQPW